MSLLFDTPIATQRYVLNQGRWEKGFALGMITAVIAGLFLFMLYSIVEHKGIFRQSPAADSALEQYARSPISPAPLNDYLVPN